MKKRWLMMMNIVCSRLKFEKDDIATLKKIMMEDKMA
tara:strand:- start:191 stop:301 length:111 start_codon:yes stop_codon:yes gene_type:complete